MAFIYNLLDTWNNAGTVFSGIKLNVTNTASAAGSKLIDLQIGGSTFFNVDKSGQVALLAGTAAAPTLIPTGDTNTGMWFPAADTVAWSTNGTEKMRLNTNGFLGIGTSSPSVQLDIRSANAFSPQLLVVNSTVDAFGPYWNTRKLRGSAAANSGDDLGTFMFQSADTGGTLRNAIWIAAKSQGAGATWHSGYFQFNTIDTSGNFKIPLIVIDTGIRVTPGTASLPGVSQINDAVTGLWWPSVGTLAASTNGSERLRIDGSGNVGIGTSAPDARLSVNGIASFGAGAAATPSIAAFGDLNTGFWFPAADTIAASTAGSERLRVDANGNVVINTAAIATTATNGFLYVPSCAGTPTGTPTTFTGRVPIVVDTTNNKLYFYSGGQWRDAGP